MDWLLFYEMKVGEEIKNPHSSKIGVQNFEPEHASNS